MSNTLDLLETNDFPTLTAIPDGIVTLIDSQTKELSNFIKYQPTGSLPNVDGVMYLENGSDIYRRIYNGVINPLWFGLNRTSTELQKAIDAAKPNDTILIQGQFDCSAKLTIGKPLTLKGQNSVNGNDPGGQENSFIYFWDDREVCIDSTANLNIKNVTISGANDKTEIGVNLYNAALTLDSAVIQNFKTGVKIEAGYYNKLTNSAIVSCSTCLVLDNCYNTNANSLSIESGYYEPANSNPTININSIGIALYNGSNLNIFGGSIEGFSANGIVLSASRVSCFGTYFEGENAIEGETSCIKVLNNNCRLTAISCHIYLTAGHASTFVHIPSTVTSSHIYSKNNYFEYETVNDWYTSVYKFAATDFTNYNIEISGDNYKNDLVVGSSYTSITSSLLQKGKGIVQITYPSGHQLAGIHLTNLNTISPYQYNDDILKLQNGTITTFSNNGGLNDDPLGLHTESYGYNPYTVVMENGEWKKIPKIN
ncbi:MULTISPECIES: hypothetical protein [Chryseobacterium]|uniref:Uncharacterized protein n=1 Tax=Chryseobacterium geocarposphaerae TaxID=1416776 RepID=A0ABU1LCA2_9FLAO|nr:MULTISPECIES: hypothetical protein [Chryseobacterium]MDR6404225.1 hypothetical protein [Chryseobacterium geocarposphaerae]MDR6699307.1 hypothetical protein [Chryseobacterium ginsenosidimutans]